MLINEAMAISTLVGRQARIQLITIVMLGTFFLLRPGSMAPSCKQYVQEKKVFFYFKSRSKFISDECSTRNSETSKRYSCSVHASGRSSLMLATTRCVHPLLFSCYRSSKIQGYNASMAKETFITLLSVTKNHNAIFDPCIWMLLHLLHQGALKDIDTVEDLIAYQGAQIYIKDEMKHMPL